MWDAIPPTDLPPAFLWEPNCLHSWCTPPAPSHRPAAILSPPPLTSYTDLTPQPGAPPASRPLLLCVLVRSASVTHFIPVFKNLIKKPSLITWCKVMRSYLQLLPYRYHLSFSTIYINIGVFKELMGNACYLKKYSMDFKHLDTKINLSFNSIFHELFEVPLYQNTKSQPLLEN